MVEQAEPVAQGEREHPALRTPSAKADSPAINTGAPMALVKSPTDTESPREFLWAHVALIGITLAVSLPHPVARLWGGLQDASPTAAFTYAGAWACSTAIIWSRLARSATTGSTESWGGSLLLLDVVGITALLSTNGAAQNPFTMLYFVPITLATLVSHRWTWRIAALSVCGFGLLLAQTAEVLRPHRHHPHHAHFYDHVQGMAIALAIAGLFITLFVGLIARSLASQRARILALSEQQKRDRFAVALGALSAGAAHELGSPLASIQLLAEDLPHLSSEERASAAQTIVEESQRMKMIVHGMQSSELSADALGDGRSWSLTELGDEVSSLPQTQIQSQGAAPTTQARQILGQILRELHRNARQADPQGLITVSLETSNNRLLISVKDKGPGLSEERLQRAMEPFVSGTGSTGLGLFLGSIHAQQLGGQLELLSEEGRGTEARLTLPLHPPFSRSAKHRLNEGRVHD